jgi:hypothetical protein
MRTIAICISLLFFASLGAHGQSQQSPARYLHQIYINDTIRSVEKVIYSDDSTAIEFQLSDDKTSIHLLNYDGKRSVRTLYTDKTGAPQNVTKPHCQISDLMVL